MTKLLGNCDPENFRSFYNFFYYKKILVFWTALTECDIKKKISTFFVQKRCIISTIFTVLLYKLLKCVVFLLLFIHFTGEIRAFFCIIVYFRWKFVTTMNIPKFMAFSNIFLTFSPVFSVPFRGILAAFFCWICAFRWEFVTNERYSDKIVDFLLPLCMNFYTFLSKYLLFLPFWGPALKICY